VYQPPAPRRWLPRPQFSLRLLLLAVTAFAIGFPVWYQWPIEEVTLEYPRISARLGSRSVLIEDKKSPPIRRTVTTWRRSWGKDKVKHGPKRYYLLDSGHVFVTHYGNDQRHGPYVHTAKDGVRESGQYAHDRKEGKWTTVDSRAGLRAVVEWHDGQIHGHAEIHYPDGHYDQLQFDRGLVTHRNDQPVSSALLDRIRRGEIGDARVTESLQAESKAHSGNSLSGWASWRSVIHESNVPLLVSPAVADPKAPFDARIAGINFQSELIVLTQRHGLDCDYRYGCLWITTPEDAKDWRDPTGVSDLKLEPGSLLEAAWNEPIHVRRYDEPLDKILAKILAPLGVVIDTTRIGPIASQSELFPANFHQSMDGNRLRLRDLLGLLLYRTGCRCELREGTLVILPPEPSANQQ
jgi:hypothetical protein